jgi:N-acetyl-gamma-glutamyl-phosphate reductase
MEISVFGNEDIILLAARYDNLGKGASGAAIECMNISIGSCLTEGLNI